MQQSYDSLKQSLADLQDTNNLCSNQNLLLSSKVKDFECHIDQLTEENKLLSSKVKDCECQINQLTEENKLLSSKVIACEGHIDQLTNDYKQLSDKVKDSECVLDQRNNEENQLLSKVRDSQIIIDQLVEENKLLSSKVKDSEVAFDQLFAENKSLKSNVKDFEGACDRLLVENKQLESKVKDFENACCQATEEIYELKIKVNDLALLNENLQLLQDKSLNNENEHQKTENNVLSEREIRLRNQDVKLHANSLSLLNETKETKSQLEDIECNLKNNEPFVEVVGSSTEALISLKISNNSEAESKTCDLINFSETSEVLAIEYENNPLFFADNGKIKQNMMPELACAGCISENLAYANFAKSNSLLSQKIPGLPPGSNFDILIQTLASRGNVESSCCLTVASAGNMTVLEKVKKVNKLMLDSIEILDPNMHLNQAEDSILNQDKSFVGDNSGCLLVPLLSSSDVSIENENIDINTGGQELAHFQLGAISVEPPPTHLVPKPLKTGHFIEQSNKVSPVPVDLLSLTEASLTLICNKSASQMQLNCNVTNSVTVHTDTKLSELCNRLDAFASKRSQQCHTTDDNLNKDTCVDTQNKIQASNAISNSDLSKANALELYSSLLKDDKAASVLDTKYCASIPSPSWQNNKLLCNTSLPSYLSTYAVQIGNMGQTTVTTEKCSLFSQLSDQNPVLALDKTEHSLSNATSTTTSYMTKIPRVSVISLKESVTSTSINPDSAECKLKSAISSSSFSQRKHFWAPPSMQSFLNKLEMTAVLNNNSNTLSGECVLDQSRKEISNVG